MRNNKENFKLHVQCLIYFVPSEGKSALGLMASTWSFSSIVVGAEVLVLVVIMALGLTLSLGLSAAEPQAESRVLTGLYQPLTA